MAFNNSSEHLLELPWQRYNVATKLIYNGYGFCRGFGEMYAMDAVVWCKALVMLWRIMYLANMVLCNYGPYFHDVFLSERSSCVIFFINTQNWYGNRLSLPKPYILWNQNLLPSLSCARPWIRPTPYISKINYGWLYIPCDYISWCILSYRAIDGDKLWKK